MKNYKDLIKYVVENLDVSYWDMIRELEVEEQQENNKQRNENDIRRQTMSQEDLVKEQVIEILDYVNITDDKEIKRLVKEKNDCWNDKNKDDDYFCDLSSEWADNQVDIYNYDLWKNAETFSEYIEDGINEFGFDKERGIIGILQMGQYKFYSEFSGQVLNLVANYLKED